MAPTDKLKQSLYFPENILSEIAEEAHRLDRSLSWMVQQAWRVAREQVRQFGFVDHRGRAEPERPPDPEPCSADADRRPMSLELREFLKGKFDRELTS